MSENQQKQQDVFADFFFIFKFTMRDDMPNPDDVPEFCPAFDMTDDLPLALTLLMGTAFITAGAIDRMEIAACLDIKEDSYTVAQKAYGAGRIYGDGGEPYMIMMAGREMLAQLLTGKIQDSIANIGIGSGTAEETPDDKGMQDECQVPLTLCEVVDNTRARFEFAIGKEASNGINIREFDLFTERDKMFSHYVRPASAEDLIKIIYNQL